MLRIAAIKYNSGQDSGEPDGNGGSLERNKKRGGDCYPLTARIAIPGICKNNVTKIHH